MYKRRPRIVLPAQPLQQLLLGDALSPRIGDLIVRLLSKPAFSYLIGLYRGRVYEHHPSRGEPDDASRTGPKAVGNPY